LQSALASYEIWLAEEPADPAAQEAYGSALFRVAEIRRRIGQYELAEPIFLKARDQYQRLVDDAPAIVPRRHGLAETWNFLGENYRESGRLLEAIRAYDAAMQHQEILSGQVPREPHYQADIGRSLYNRGLARRDLNELPAAEQDFRRSIQLLQQCLTGHARLDRPRQDLARSQNNLGILLRATQRPQEAQQQYQAAIETLRSLQREFPASADYPFELATVLMNQANLLLADQRSRQLEIAQPLDEAEKTYQASVEIFRELSRQYANVPRYRKGLANSLNGLGAVLSQLTRNEDAEDVWLQASQELKQLVDGSPNVAEYHGLLAQTTHNLAYLHRNDDDPAVVEELLREAVDRQGRAHALSPNNALYADGLRTYQKNLARVLVEAGKHHQAADIAEQLAAGDSGDSRALYDAAKILAACLSRLERAPDTADPAAADPAAADPAAADPAAADHYRRRIQTHLARCRAHGLAIQASDFPGLALP
jgi:tetratricopeptide (TPR) repeat protein